MEIISSEAEILEDIIEIAKKDLKIYSFGDGFFFKCQCTFKFNFKNNKLVIQF